jgi:hypothetical protein
MVVRAELICVVLLVGFFAVDAVICGWSGSTCSGNWPCDKFCINIGRKGGNCIYTADQDRCVCNCIDSNGVSYPMDDPRVTNNTIGGNHTYDQECGSMNFIKCYGCGGTGCSGVTSASCHCNGHCTDCGSETICCPVGKSAKCFCRNGGSTCICK